MAADPEMAAHLDCALEIAADAVGDIVPSAMALFYARFPEALASFEHHGLGKRETLEREMVDNALYCLMTWPVRKSEVQILIYGSIPHHKDTLQVSEHWYQGLIVAVIDVVVGALPASADAERAALSGIKSGLDSAIFDALL